VKKRASRRTAAAVRQLRHSNNGELAALGGGI
jgi:hypothetical protein